MRDARRASPILLGLTLILFLLCGILWSVAIPPFESPDEPGHARFVNFLLDHGRLPVAGEEAPGEAHQPPLYYAIAAAAARVLALDPIAVEPVRNTAFRWYGGSEENKYLHSSAEPAPTLRRLRLLSVVMGAATVALIYRMALASGVLSPAGAALAAAFAAFLPQHTFISASLNNDNLANLLATAALMSLLVAVRDPSRMPAWCAAGLLSGIGLLAKFTGLALLPAGLIALYLARRAGSVGPRAAAFFLLPALLVPAPLLIRNALLLGDPFGVSAQARTLPNLLDPKGLGSTYFITEFPAVLFESFWGRFGWMSFRLPGLLYLAALAVSLAALCGLVMGWRRQRERLPSASLLLLAASIIIQLGQVAAYNLTFTQAQGRFLFPVLGPIAILFTFGTGEIARRSGLGGMTRPRGMVLIAALAASNLCLLALLVAPAYRTAAVLP